MLKKKKKSCLWSILLKKWSSKLKNVDYRYTYSNCTIHHHCTDCEHEEGDGKQNAGIFCIKKDTKISISHFLKLPHCTWQAHKFYLLLWSILTQLFPLCKMEVEGLSNSVFYWRKKSWFKKTCRHSEKKSVLIESLNKAQTHQLEAWQSSTAMQHNDSYLHYVSVESMWVINFTIGKSFKWSQHTINLSTWKRFDYIIWSLAGETALLLKYQQGK